MHRRTLLALLSLTAVALLLALAVRSGRAPEVGASSPEYVSFEGEAMATRWRLTLPAGPQAEAAAREVFALFADIDAGMSEWKESSPLAAVNRAAGGEAVAVPADLLAVIRRSLEIGEATGGAFDITWAALWGLWTFRAPAPRVPDPAEIARRTALVDYRRVEIDEAAGTVRLPRAGMKIGLGGIAKGWALDRAAERLRRRGVTSFLLQGGGQVLAGGGRRTGGGERPWRVGIRDPRGGPEDVFAEVEIRDASASTSGDYESFFIIDGVRYHHILDPRTGWPARGLSSATVISPDATLADALSTALMVLGPERGLALAEEMPEVEAVLVDGAGEVLTTSGLEGKLVLHR